MPLATTRPLRAPRSRRSGARAERPVRAGLLVAGLFAAASLLGCHNPQSADRRAQPNSPATSEPSGDEPEPGSPPSETTPSSRADESGDDRSDIPPPTPLESFFRALDETEGDETARVTRILQIGDSHTASDTLTGKLRELFQRKFGSAGRGYAYPGVPWNSFRQEQMSYAASSDWTTALGTDDDARPPFPAGGVRVETSEEGAWLERRVCGLDRDDSTAPDADGCTFGDSFDRFSVFYLVRPEGGTFTVAVDGDDPTAVETAGDAPRVGIYRRRVEPGAHSLRIETRGDGPVSLSGIRTGSGDDGVELSSLGINGATGPEFGSFDRELTRQEVRALDPDLLVLAFGANEAFNFHRMHDDPDVSKETIIERLEDYQFAFDRMVRRFRSAAPGASCLVLLPPDVAPLREDAGCRSRPEVDGEAICLPPTVRHYAAVVAAQRAAAKRRECAVWNQSRAMGGAGSIQYWAALDPPLAQTDGVHLTMKGYHELAERFFADLTRSYSRWKEGRRAPLETTPLEKSPTPDDPRASGADPP